MSWRPCKADPYRIFSRHSLRVALATGFMCIDSRLAVYAANPSSGALTNPCSRNRNMPRPAVHLTHDMVLLESVSLGVLAHTLFPCDLTASSSDRLPSPSALFHRSLVSWGVAASFPSFSLPFLFCSQTFKYGGLATFCLAQGHACVCFSYHFWNQVWSVRTTFPVRIHRLCSMGT